MKKTVFFYLAFCLTGTLQGCYDSLQTHWSEGPYAVWDSPSNPSCRDLVYKLGGGAGITRVDCVFRLGFNERYIIAESGGGRTAFWILDREKDRRRFKSDEAVEGPFTLEEFSTKKEELGISSLRFEREFR